jgi:hypothetical protein
MKVSEMQFILGNRHVLGKKMRFLIIKMLEPCTLILGIKSLPNSIIYSLIQNFRILRQSRNSFTRVTFADIVLSDIDLSLIGNC